MVKKWLISVIADNLQTSFNAWFGCSPKLCKYFNRKSLFVFDIVLRGNAEDEISAINIADNLHLFGFVWFFFGNIHEQLSVHVCVGALSGLIKSLFSFNFCAGQTCGSSSVMSSPWWEQWPLLASNGTAPPDNTSCLGPSQSTTFNTLNFGGVPVVLLLNFSVFLVCFCPSKQKIHLIKTHFTLLFIEVFLLQLAGVADSFFHHQEKILGLRTSGVSRRQRWVS